MTPELLAEIGPTAVLMPLISAEQDALIMIEALALLGFSGTILVLAPPLPNPELVERELRAVGPGLQLMLVSA
ncbi:hypothetical protein GC209_08640 [bacterium]|nr:hypothetical protein [bacterium]